MLTLILFPILVIGFILFGLFAKHKSEKGSYVVNWDFWYMTSFIIAFIASVFTIILPLTLINRNARFGYIVGQYENTKAIVNQYNKEPNASVYRIDSGQGISKEVLKMNNTISEHKVMSKSPWVGPWYSEKVGNLDKLKLNE